MEKVECLFCLSLYRSDLLQASAHSNSIWEGEQPAMGEENVRDHLVKLNIFTSMRLDEIHPSALIELSDAIVRLLPVIYKINPPRKLKRDFLQGHVVIGQGVMALNCKRVGLDEI